jgi:hypothetical protein
MRGFTLSDQRKPERFSSLAVRSHSSTFPIKLRSRPCCERPSRVESAVPHQMALTGVAVEKVQFPPNSQKLGDTKCLEN